MAKTAGYMREYRSRRADNAGMALTDPWSPLGIERAAPTASRGPSLIDEIKPPPGRAPRGEGAEYAARRWLSNQVYQTDKNLAELNRKLRTSRGQKSLRRRDTKAITRRQLLQEYRRNIEQVVRAPGSWAVKKEIISMIRGPLMSQYLS